MEAQKVSKVRRESFYLSKLDVLNAVCIFFLLSKDILCAQSERHQDYLSIAFSMLMLFHGKKNSKK
jgi:hypothetical protein